MKKFFVLLVTLLLAGCATGVKKEIESEKKTIDNMYTRAEFIEKTRDVFEHSSLSDDQKEKFIKLHTDVMEDVQVYGQDIRKLKLILFKELTSKDYNPEKVFQLTKQIKKIQKKRTDRMFKALNQAKIILGRDADEVFGSQWVRDYYRF